MFILGNFVIGIGVALRVFLNIEIVFIIISALLSWIPEAHYHRVYHFFQGVADIVENPIRRIIPRIGPIDITPILAIILIIFLDRFIAQSLIELGYLLK
ncbi:YggT family protein [Thermosipho ferrireducens]|uniref:YggT family protein n=1 Tax=Thermosipho ferrireducens TaxID=2571116 RepID=A0ABX7S4R4_9BACT|nr:YggT family protein [Thermosipho ferrireducens]QTA37466.1 YggT family protein [Thermosipho ferrireducens]